MKKGKRKEKTKKKEGRKKGKREKKRKNEEKEEQRKERKKGNMKKVKKKNEATRPRLVSSLSLSCRVYRGCPCRDPRGCHRVQDDSVAKRIPFVEVVVGVVMLCGRRVRVHGRETVSDATENLQKKEKMEKKKNVRKRKKAKKKREN